MTFYKQKQLPRHIELSKPTTVQAIDKYISSFRFESFQLIKRVLYTTQSSITISQVRAVCIYGFLLLGITIQGLAITTPYFNPWNTRPIIYTLYGTYWSLVQGAQSVSSHKSSIKQLSKSTNEADPVISNWSLNNISKLLTKNNSSFQSSEDLSTCVQRSYLKQIISNWSSSESALKFRHQFNELPESNIGDSHSLKHNLYGIAKKRAFSDQLSTLSNSFNSITFLEDMVIADQAMLKQDSSSNKNYSTPFSFYQRQKFIQEARATFNKTLDSVSYFSNIPDPGLSNIVVVPRLQSDYNMGLQQKHGFPYRNRPASIATNYNTNKFVTNENVNVLFTFNPLNLSDEVYKYYHTLAPIPQRVTKFLITPDNTPAFYPMGEMWKQLIISRFAAILPWCGPICGALLIHSVYEIFGGYFFEKFGQDPLQRYSLDKYVLWPQHNTLSLTVNQNRINDFGMLNDESYSLLECLGKFSNKQRKNEITELRRRKGTLLIGSAESGKFSFACALAGEAFVPFIFIPANRFASRSLDETLLLVQIIFYIGQKVSPCIIYFEDIQSFCQVRSALDIPDSARNLKRMVTQYHAKQSISLHENLFTFITNRYQIFFKSLYSIATNSRFITSFNKLHNSLSTPRLSAQQSSRNDGSDVNRVVLLNHFLVKLEKCLASSSPILVLASTPKLSILDPALIRPGRLSYHLFFDPVSYHGRKNMLNSILSRQSVSTQLPIGFLAHQLDQFDRVSLQKYITTCLLHAYLYHTNNKNLVTATFRTGYVKQLLGAISSNTNASKESCTKISSNWYKQFSQISLTEVPQLAQTEYNSVSSLFGQATIPDSDYLQLTESRPQVRTLYNLLQNPTSVFSISLIEQLWAEGSPFLQTTKHTDLLFYMANTFSRIPTGLVLQPYSPFQYSSESPDSYSPVQFAISRKTKTSIGIRSVDSLEESTNQVITTQWAQTQTSLIPIHSRSLLSTNLLIEYHAWLYFQFYKVILKLDDKLCSQMQ